MSDRLPPGYEFSADSDRVDLERVHHWLSTDAHWALGRSLEKQRQAMAGSLNYGMYSVPDGRQAAYCRIVTDSATFAWLCDVYVDRQDRGKGLGIALVASVCEHLEPLGLRRIVLATADAQGVYAKVGFEPLPHPERWMAR